MKRFLLSAAVAVAFFSASTNSVQAQSKSTVGSSVNTSAAPAARPNEQEWPALETWNEPSAVDSARSGWETAATDDSDPMMRSSGVSVAPGMSSSPYRGTSTDYHGRPIAKTKSKRPRSVDVAQDDPMMKSSGVMIAPGMSSSPYRGTSTDYNGRPIRKPAPATTATAQTATSDTDEPMAASW